MSEFFAMGGYAIYVWPAYAIAAIVLAANVIEPLMRMRRIKRQQGKQQIDPRHENTPGVEVDA